jgi:hypothetical protein
MVVLGAGCVDSPVVAEEVCAICRKIVVRPPPEWEVEVREGEKLFHLDCYLAYKRRQ